MPDQEKLQHHLRQLAAALLLVSCLSLLLVFLHWDIKPDLLVLAWLVIALQSLFIIDIQISRRRHKRSEKQLKTARTDLEQRVSERTDRMRHINNQLYDEIAKHELTEVRLRETQEYLHSIINSMPSELIGVTRDGEITHWNTAAQKATNIPADLALGRNLHDIYPELPVDSKLINETISNGAPQTRENLAHNFGDERRHIDMTIYPLMSSQLTGVVIRVDDVSLRVRMESMMIQNEKMMSLGELAAGIAHEINNPLTAIMNSVQNIYRRTSMELPQNKLKAEELGTSLEQVQAYLQTREIFSFLDAIQEAGERSAKIVNNMLEFSRTSISERQLTDIGALIDHSLELAVNSFGLASATGKKNVRIKKEFYPNLPLIDCSQIELQQVFLNLIINAYQAFGLDQTKSTVEPMLTLRTRADSRYIYIEIEDNGPGIPESICRHIFEPFFTTKEAGQGTGLGLSISYFIITEHHDGTIEVETEPGRGTTFIISLPITSSK
ncbi:MAG: PAS domain-containing protein [Gammaproteobacteria bacterium]|uniref:two-component system sensor histidine kinase NtrB n=1 Tax=Pseudomaricurvus alcaniphilus TaxID=1166482 RepID=UPI00140B4656|nr:ATP-binding protein [Pseudomaricurvus alcaniphilus]MBR9912330.1 PAS domain-containing protein [Gammaproteobacteria bacterium]NHN39310.1 PAS domain-containing protein [Pseudomaricurvus alcaniphilus]